MNSRLKQIVLALAILISGTAAHASSDSCEIAFDSLSAFFTHEPLTYRIQGYDHHTTNLLSLPPGDAYRAVLAKLNVNPSPALDAKSTHAVTSQSDVLEAYAIPLPNANEDLIATWTPPVFGPTSRLRIVDRNSREIGRSLELPDVKEALLKAAVPTGDGRYIIAFFDSQTAATTGKFAAVWNITSGKYVHTLDRQRLISLIKPSPDDTHNSPTVTSAFDLYGKFLATAHNNGDVVIWNYVTGEKLSTLWQWPFMRKAIKKVSFTEEGKGLRVEFRDGTSRFYQSK